MKNLLLLLTVLIVSCYSKTAQEYFSMYEQSMKKEDFVKAIEYISLAIELEPESPRYYMLRSDCYSRINKYKEAISDLTIIIDHGGGTVLEYYNRGIFKVNIEDYDGAISDFEAAYKDQEYIDCLYQIGRVYNLKGDYNKVIEILTKTIEKNDKLGHAFNERGLSFWKLDNHDKACEDWVKGASLNDEDAVKNLKQYCKDGADL